MHFILQLLSVTIYSEEMWQTFELNSIINATPKEYKTLAFFGKMRDIEPFVQIRDLKDIPRLVITRNYGSINFNDGSHINQNIFFIAVGFLDRKALWNHMHMAFRGIQGRARGVFITDKPKQKQERFNMEEHFEWCWKRGFTNALVLVDDSRKMNVRKYQIYNYNHFAHTRIINMTDFDKADLYADKFRDLLQYKIRTLAQFDPPRVFDRRNCSGSNKNRIFGYVASLFEAFLKEYNAGMDVLYSIKNNTYNIMAIIERINNDEVDVAINPYIPAKDVHLSYPIRMLRRCIVVPFPEELPKYKYFIMPFETPVWLSFLGTWIALSLARIFGCFFGHPYRALDKIHVFLEVWRLIMYLPASMSSRYEHYKWFNAIFFSFIAMIGFILSNLYLASLTSYFSGLSFELPINTLAELISSNITVDAIDFDIPAILYNRDLPYGLSGLLRKRNGPDLINDILALKPNHSYTALEDRIYFAFSQQIHLRRPYSHMIMECLTTMPFGFLMPPHSLFEKPLNRFILRSSSAGLLNKWILDSVQDGYCTGIITMRKPQLTVARPLTLEHFQFGWFVLAGGYVIGLSVFLAENMQRIFKRIKIFIVFL